MQQPTPVTIIHDKSQQNWKHPIVHYIFEDEIIPINITQEHCILVGLSEDGEKVENMYSLSHNFQITVGTKNKSPTAAIFDLGGGSTQIVFEPGSLDGYKVAPGEHRYELEYGGHKYILYQHSYLHFGLMEAKKAIISFMVKLWNNSIDGIKNDLISDISLSYDGNLKDEFYIPHTCLPKNYSESWQIDIDNDDDNSVKLIGTGGGHVQCRPLGMLSEFTLKELCDLTDQVCSGNYKRFSYLPEAVKELKKNPYYCMNLSFIYELLHTGYEIPLEREIKIETGWCLGASIAMLDQSFWCKEF
ncbi:16606_t:CDS:2 [Entrophospora sp. SA101]|nr:16606_t:CDS:2 [Entrophospora sp. SA101]